MAMKDFEITARHIVRAESLEDAQEMVPDAIDMWVSDPESLDVQPLEEAPSHWDDDDGFPVGDWQDEVANGDTRQSYREWVQSQRQAQE